MITRTPTLVTLFRFTLALTIALAGFACGRAPLDDTAVTRGAIVETAAATACTGDWTVVDSPNVGGQDNALASVAASSPRDVWAVGQFVPDANPNITLTLAEHFDGRAWSVVATPNVGTNRGNALLSVASKAGRAWAVGYDIGDDFLSHSLIEAWDGQAWHVVDHPQPFDTENLYGVAAVSPHDVWAVGSGRDGEGAFHTVALHFDGHNWSSLPPVDPGVNGNVLYGVVAKAPNDVWAVGQKLGAAPPDEALVEHWDGARWSEVPAGVAGGATATASTQLLAVDVVADRDVRAAGDAQDGVVSLRTFAVSSERERFSAPGTPDPGTGDNRLTGVAAVNDDETWAVGSYIDDDSGNLLTLIASGGEDAPWTQAPSPSPAGDGDNQLAAVTAVGGRDLWSVGAFDGPDAQQTLVLHRCK